jgi:hypothetical protein
MQHARAFGDKSRAFGDVTSKVSLVKEASPS